MPSWFESGSRHADSVNETWFEFVNVAVSDLAELGALVAGAERKPTRPDAVAVSKRPTASAPRTAVIFPPLKARFLIPVPSSVVDSCARRSRGRVQVSGGGRPLVGALSPSRSDSCRRHGHSQMSLGPSESLQQTAIAVSGAYCNCLRGRRIGLRPLIDRVWTRAYASGASGRGAISGNRLRPDPDRRRRRGISRVRRHPARP